jgi:hypothetical protein
MALVLADRVKESTVTTGTTDFALGGADTGFQTFSAGVGANNTTYYAVSLGSDWEIGLGTLSSDGLTLARTTVLQSSNSDSKVSFAAGTKYVFVTYPADKAVLTDNSQTLTNKTINGSSNTISNIALTSQVTGTLPVSNGGTGVTTSTGTGSVVLSNSPTLVTPALGTPASGTLTNATGLPISTGVSGLGTGVATFLGTPSSANLASAVTDETGSGALVFANSPTLVTPALGTPASATLTNATGLPLSTGVTGTLPVSNGGTGATSLTANNVILGNGTDAVQVVAPSTSGNVLTSNGTTWVSQTPTSSGITTGKAIAMAIVFGG